MAEKYKYIFGPVTSRRLGISLGIDLIPYKTCSFDCVYCECGKTTSLTTEIKEHIPYDELEEELKRYLSGDVALDAITFAGSGEPTLHSRIGDVITFLKENYPQYKVVLLTNSTLFHIDEVRKSVLDADTIIASFDAGTDPVFRKINRGEKNLLLSDMKEGLLRLSREYQKELIIEVFIIPGVNDTDEELKEIKDFVKELNPSGIQINTMDRPGTCDWVQVLSEEKKKEIEEYFGVNKKIKNEFKTSEKREVKDLGSMITDTIKRRPCTAMDLKNITGEDEEIERILAELVDEGKIELKKMPRGEFYFLK